MPKTIKLIKEEFDNNKEEFTYDVVKEIVIEHSLLSISKWEMKYHKPFMSSEKSPEETLDYIAMMVIEPKDFDISLLQYLRKEDMTAINDYLADPMTATTFPDDEVSKMAGQSKMKKKEIITNELVYYWMCCAQIPFECEKWNINHLLTLIRVHDFKNNQATNKKKMSKQDIMARNKALNEARRAKMHTKG